MKQIAAVLFLLMSSVSFQDKAAAADTLAGRCATFVRDARPPANVRVAPNGSPVRALPNDVELQVDDDRGGWLHITSPAIGWIHESVTVVYGGSKSLANNDLLVYAR